MNKIVDDYEGFSPIRVGEGITKEWTDEYDGI